MMQHAPMNTLVAILSSALGSLYTQTISLLVLLVLHTMFNPIVIHDWSGAFMMYLLAWGRAARSVCAHGGETVGSRCRVHHPVGLCPRQHDRIGQDVRGEHAARLMLAMFDWNPLFHIIDQGAASSS
jgi:hypothetical protein